MASGSRGPLEYQLLLEILAELSVSSDLPNTAQFACRCGDSRFDFRRKILNILVADAGLPNTAQFSWRPGDSESQIILKWLLAIGGDCRCGDTAWNLYQRFLEQLRINSGLPNTPAFAFRAGDTLLDILAKILNNLQNAVTPPVPPVDLCCGLDAGDWGLITSPITEQCDWGDLVTTPDCFADFGTVP